MSQKQHCQTTQNEIVQLIRNTHGSETPAAPFRSPIAYCFSRFPLITETFVLNEILWLQHHGVQVEVFPLMKEKSRVVHEGAKELLNRIHYRPLLSFDVATAQCYWIARKPLTYLRCWTQAILGNWKSPAFLLRSLFVIPKAAWFARTMEKLHIAHVHVHFATHAALAAFCIRQLTSISYSITVHSGDIFANRSMLREKILNSERVMAISLFNKKFLAELYGPTVDAKIHVMRCGVDLANLPNGPSPKRKSPVPILACIASFDYYKGHRYLIEACLELKRRGQRFVCLCIGQGQDFHHIKKMVALHQLHEIRLLGARPHDQVLKILAGATLSVLPSIVMKTGKTEGIPVALMESLAFQVPVVASDLSGIPELITSGVCGGILVPQKDPIHLANAIQSLLANPSLAQTLGERGRKRVEDLFDLQKNMEEKKQFFQNMASDISPFTQ